MMSFTAPGPTGPNFEALAAAGIQLNGAFDYRQAQEASVAIGSFTGYVADQWEIGSGGSFVGTFDLDAADVPDGFRTCAKITIGTAEASLGASDVLSLYQPIEGSRIYRAGFGTVSAQTLTLSFWCKAHRIGQYSGVFKNAAQNRVYGFTYNINVADTWEFKTLQIPGDTAGTWLKTNALAAYLEFCLAGGSSTLIAGGAWGTTNAHGVTGQVNGVGATTDVFRITGVHLAPGAWNVQALGSSRLMRSAETELALCQRYYEKSYNLGTAPGTATNPGLQAHAAPVSGANNSAQGTVTYSIRKRTTAPTVTLRDLAGVANKLTITLNIGGATSGVTPSTGVSFGSDRGFTIVHSDATAGYAGYYAHWTSDDRM